VPILLFILIVVLIAQIGFWKTLVAILGALAMFVLLFMLGIAILVMAGFWIAGRLTRGPNRDGWDRACCTERTTLLYVSYNIACRRLS
jgi:hypothetical protein